jgi:hypothetical protein
MLALSLVGGHETYLPRDLNKAFSHTRARNLGRTFETASCHGGGTTFPRAPPAAGCLAGGLDGRRQALVPLFGRDIALDLMLTESAIWLPSCCGWRGRGIATLHDGAMVQARYSEGDDGRCSQPERTSNSHGHYVSDTTWSRGLNMCPSTYEIRPSLRSLHSLLCRMPPGVMTRHFA